MEVSKTFLFSKQQFFRGFNSLISVHVYTSQESLRIRGIYYLILISYQIILIWQITIPMEKIS